MTQPALRAPGLDTLRALAILAVMLYHLQYYLPEQLLTIGRFGWMGVDLFFVLSGYLIGLQLLKPYRAGGRPSLPDFYRRRAFRILPAYLVVVLVYFAYPAWRERDGIAPLWQFVTFTENLFVDIVHHGAFTHVWSLCVEEHFYLVLPLLVLAMMRRPSLLWTVLLLAGLVVLGIGLRGYLILHVLPALPADARQAAFYERVYYPTYARLDGLLAGVALALVKSLRPRWWARMARHGHAMLAASVVLTGSMMWMVRHDLREISGSTAWGMIAGLPMLSLGLGLLVASSISSNGWLSRWRIPGAQLLATLAYSLYLTHKAVAHLDRVYLPRLTESNGLAALLLYAATCPAAAAVLYLCVERPCLRLRARLERKPRRAPLEAMHKEPAL